jgi:H+-transporting ATPase
MFTDDPLDITKENGRRLGIGDNILSCKIFAENLTTESDYQDIDDLILHADGFADVDGEKKCEIVQRLQNMGHIIAVTRNNHQFRQTLTRADIDIAVPKLSDANFSIADIVLIESNLSLIIKGKKN